LELFSEHFRGIDLHVNEFALGLLVPRVALHEKTRVAVPAVDLAACVRVDAVVEDLRLVQDAFGGKGPFPDADSPETTPPRSRAHQIYAKCTEFSVVDSRESASRPPVRE